MQEGFIPDHGDMAATWVSVWVAGSPKAKQGFWKKAQTGYGVESWGEEDAWAISAHRCAACGLVELYAMERPDPDATLRKPK